MQFEQVKAFIFDKLERELPGYLTYHTVGHVKDVFGAAENLGRLESITEYELQLLLTAALFHDAGFIHGIKEHEKESCRIAAEYLPDFGYSDDAIEKISGMILATRVPQLPKNHLQEIICDADLDYLGRDDFFTISDSLFEEFIKTDFINRDEDKWNRLQVSFFESHRYFTASALQLRVKKKEENLLAIKSKIGRQS
jgi:uncharacterized protein